MNNDQEKQMDWNDWKNKYQPVMINATQDDGDIMEFDKVQETIDWVRTNWANLPEEDIYKYVWTTTAGDGWSYTSTGFHVVDKECHMVCNIPWTHENEACVYYDQGSYCEYCDENVQSCIHDDEDWQDKEDAKSQDDRNS